ncbi:hypothetical protein DESC_720038 [Desulfosarcina cetonica]|nr:hypothetical protein DESC_720038 [Desulfosarcina cetonica]
MGQLTVRGVCAFDQRDGLGQDAAVARANTIDVELGLFFTHEHS